MDVDPWAARKCEIDRRTAYRRQLANICGCQHCDDRDRAEELACLIARSTELILSYEDALMDGATT